MSLCAETIRCEILTFFFNTYMGNTTILPRYECERACMLYVKPFKWNLKLHWSFFLAKIWHSQSYVRRLGKKKESLLTWLNRENYQDYHCFHIVHFWHLKNMAISYRQFGYALIVWQQDFHVETTTKTSKIKRNVWSYQIILTPKWTSYRFWQI